MEYLLPCSCGQPSQVSKTQAGQTLQCSSCGKELEVPPLRGFSGLEVISDPAPAVVEKNHWRGLRGILFAVFAVLAVYATLRTGMFAWNGNLVDTSLSVEDYLEDTNVEWQRYGPMELTQIWDEMGQYALGSKQPPDFFRIQRIVENEKRSAWIAGGIAGVLWLICFAIWFTTPKTTKPV